MKVRRRSYSGVGCCCSERGLGEEELIEDVAENVDGVRRKEVFMWFEIVDMGGKMFLGGGTDVVVNVNWARYIVEVRVLRDEIYWGKRRS